MSESADRSAIEALHDDFARAWSAGEGERLMAMFAPDALRVGAMGDVQRGEAEIRASWQTLFSGPFKGASIRFDGVTTRVLSADYALWEAFIQITLPQRTLRGHVVDLMVKREERWQILETHPKMFPPKSS